MEILRESDDQLSGCDRMVCYFFPQQDHMSRALFVGTARHPDGILVGWSCWMVIPPIIWLVGGFKPSEKY